MDAFEFLLEQDYLLLLDFDDTVESFEVQPVRVQKLLQLRNATQLCRIHIDHHPWMIKSPGRQQKSGLRLTPRWNRVNLAFANVLR
jgi:hypothetical protein